MGFLVPSLLTDFVYNFRPAEQDFELYDLRKPLDRAAPVARDEMFTRALWETHFDSEGRVCRVKELQDRIFGGGCQADLRQEVWPFLLNVYPWNSTLEERAAIMEQKKKEYEVLRNQWKSITPAQMKRLDSLTIWIEIFWSCKLLF